MQNNNPTSVTGFVSSLEDARNRLLEGDTDVERKRGAIGRLCLESGCNIYFKGVTRGIDQVDFEELKAGIVKRSAFLKELSLNKRKLIVENGKQFIRDGMVWRSHLLPFHSIDNSHSRRISRGP